MKNLIKKAVPKGILTKIQALKVVDQKKKARYNKILQNNKISDPKLHKIFILGAPEHSNLGDHAIIEAEISFLKDNFPKYEPVEIPYWMVNSRLKQLIHIVDKNDIVCITGGWMGSLWPNNEDFIRKIIATFSKNKVVVFPQTAYYENESLNNPYLKSSIDIYNSHSELYLCARDRKTYMFFETYYPKANNIFVPDIAFYLNESNSEIKRDGILLCLRNDREKITALASYENIQNIIQSFDMNIKTTDTVIGHEVNMDTRSQYLNNKLDEFRSSKVVITDRLHGMIFATITGTPCIALNNKSGKVKGVYEWIKDLNYVRFTDDTSILNDQLNYLLSLKETFYDSENIRKKYKDLIGIFM